MINTLPKSLIDSATKMLNEALASSAHKAMATKASKESTNAEGLTAAERISKDVIPMGQSRLVVPLSRTSTPDKQVVSHLAANGYHIADYENGLAYHTDSPNRKIRIGRIFNMVETPTHIKTAYEKDPARQGLKSSASIVISRKPADVAAMSTHQQWQSCQTLGGKATLDGFPVTQEKGCHASMVPGIVKSGAHIAYLVHDPKDIDTHYKPIARVTLNSFVSPTGHKILRPSEVYGENWEGLHKTVNDWAEEHFPTKDPIYTRHKEAYPEGRNTISDYSPKFNDFWKNQHDPETLSNHPDPEVLHHHTQKIVEEGMGNISSLLSNPNLPESDADRLVTNFAGKKGLRQIPEIAKYAKTPKQISYIMDKNLGNYHVATALTTNQNTTGAHLHELIDTYGLGQTNIPGHREDVHFGYSPKIMSNITNHVNANETHFSKLFEHGALMNQNATTPEEISERWGANLDHTASLHNIARRYHSEDIGRKLMASQKNQPDQDHNIIYDVAEKHPHLLNDVPDRHIAKTLFRHGGSKALQNIALNRNSSETLGALASTTKDRDILEKLKQHPDLSVRTNAIINEKMLNTLENVG